MEAFKEKYHCELRSEPPGKRPILFIYSPDVERNSVLGVPYYQLDSKYPKFAAVMWDPVKQVAMKFNVQFKRGGIHNIMENKIFQTAFEVVGDEVRQYFDNIAPVGFYYEPINGGQYFSQETFRIRDNTLYSYVDGKFPIISLDSYHRLFDVHIVKDPNVFYEKEFTDITMGPDRNICKNPAELTTEILLNACK